MKLHPICCVLLVFVLGCNSQKVQRQPVTGDIKTDIQNLLPEGKLTAEIMDGIKQDSRLLELTMKLKAGISENNAWFLDYVEQIGGQDGPLPYHPNFGITEEEYNELQQDALNVEIVSTGTAELHIIKDKNIIKFKGEGKLAPLNQVKIDLSKNLVIVDEYELALADTVNVQDDKAGLKSKWKGYVWRFEEPVDFDLSALKNLETLEAKQLKFTIGQLEKNGKTYISLKSKMIANGAMQSNFEIPILF